MTLLRQKRDASSIVLVRVDGATRPDRFDVDRANCCNVRRLILPSRQRGCIRGLVFGVAFEAGLIIAAAILWRIGSFL